MGLEKGLVQFKIHGCYSVGEECNVCWGGIQTISTTKGSRLWGSYGSGVEHTCFGVGAMCIGFEWGLYRKYLKVLIRILYIIWAFGLRVEQASKKVILIVAQWQV